jgi:hypothetical protein
MNGFSAEEFDLTGSSGARKKWIISLLPLFRGHYGIGYVNYFT